MLYIGCVAEQDIVLFVLSNIHNQCSFDFGLISFCLNKPKIV